MIAMPVFFWQLETDIVNALKKSMEISVGKRISIRLKAVIVTTATLTVLVKPGVITNKPQSPKTHHNCSRLPLSVTK